MTAEQNKNQILYSSASVENTAVFNRLKTFFELRRDEDSPFSAEELLDAFQICKSGKSFAARAGDMIALLSEMPKNKRVQDSLRVRKACGLYGLMSKTDGFALQTDVIGENFNKDFYIISPKRDEKLLDKLSLETISIRVVGQVTRKGYLLFKDGEMYEELTKPEELPRHINVADDFSFKAGYLQGFSHAFTGSEVNVNGNIGMALGVFSFYHDCGCDRDFKYTGVKQGDGLFIYPVSHQNAFPDYRVKKVFKKLKKAASGGGLGGCVLFNDGNLPSAIERLTGTLPEGQVREMYEGVWYILVASHKPLRDGIYIGKV